MNVLNRSSLAELQPVAGEAVQTLSVADDAVAFETFPEACTKVWVSVTGNSVSVTLDGETEPDTAVGIALPANYAEVWSKAMAQAASFHQRGGAATVFGQPLA